MRLAHPRPHRSAELTLVALVDVLLLLVMFFILAGTFDRLGRSELLSGGAGSRTAAPPASVLVRLHPDGSADLNGERLPDARAGQPARCPPGPRRPPGAAPEAVLGDLVTLLDTLTAAALRQSSSRCACSAYG